MTKRLQLVYDTFYPPNQRWFMKVYVQPQSFIRQAQISKRLCVVNWSHGFFCFRIDYHRILHQQIQPQRGGQSVSFVMYGNRLLAFVPDFLQFKFYTLGLFIEPLQ